MTFGNITLLNCDCLQYMATVPDKFFELAIVDPPYGIGASKKTSYHDNGFQKYKSKNWDLKRPDIKYFKELLRISRNQIVWGGNYFADFLPISAKWIVWDKVQSDGIDQAMFELAYNSNETIQAKIFRYDFRLGKNNAIQRENAKKYERINPTQKPVALYKWLLKNYAKEGDKIFDSHFGSGSHGIACIDMGFNLTACELDADYFNASVERIKNHINALDLFRARPIVKVIDIHQNCIEL